MNNEVAQKIPNVYEYVLQEEQAFRVNRVPLASNWRDWNMFEHIDRSFTLKNSRFYQGNQDYRRPFNNIILPIANVNYRTEGFDVKDAQLYVDNSENYHKSFFVRKFHNWWAKENKIDTAIDESVESYFDYGLTLLKNVNEAKPDVIQLQQIAFCDQTDIMSGPICIKHNYSISELLDMKGKWKGEEIDRTILMSKHEKTDNSNNGEKAKTPGKYIEVYELHGMFPESWLGVERLGEDWQDTGKYSPQIHIISYYISPLDGKTKNGITLFKGKENKPIFKALKRDPIFGRACGRGGIEELFHPQIWTNYSELHITQMLETVSKIVLKTNKKSVKQKNNFANIKHGQIIDLDGDGTLEQLILQPVNKVAFDNFINKWEQVARTIGSASDPQLGLSPVSGTPLGTTQIVTSQGQGVHEYRQGKISEFWQEVYRDWVIPHLQSEITKGSKWLDTLTLDEMQEVSESIITKYANKKIKDMILYEGKDPSQEDADALRATLKEIFLKGGNKRFIEIMKGDLEDLPMDIEISIANKQKNLFEYVNKLNSFFRILFTPGALQAIQQSDELKKLLSEILEGSGLSPITYGVGASTTPKMGLVPSPMSPMKQEQELPITT